MQCFQFSFCACNNKFYTHYFCYNRRERLWNLLKLLNVMLFYAALCYMYTTSVSFSGHSFIFSAHNIYAAYLWLGILLLLKAAPIGGSLLHMEIQKGMEKLLFSNLISCGTTSSKWIISAHDRTTQKKIIAFVSAIF